MPTTIPRITSRPAAQSPRYPAQAFADPRGTAALGQALGDVGQAALTIYDTDQTARMSRATAEAAVEHAKLVRELDSRQDYDVHEAEYATRSKQILDAGRKGLKGVYAQQFDLNTFEIKERQALQVHQDVTAKRIDATKADTIAAMDAWGALSGGTTDPKLRAKYEEEAAKALAGASGAFSAVEITNRALRWKEDLEASDVRRLVDINPEAAIQALYAGEFSGIGPERRQIMLDGAQRAYETALTRQSLEESRRMHTEDMVEKHERKVAMKSAYMKAIPPKPGEPLRAGLSYDDLAELAPHLDTTSIHDLQEIVKNGGFLNNQVSVPEAMDPILQKVGRGEDVTEDVLREHAANRISNDLATTLLGDMAPLKRFAPQLSALKGTPEMTNAILARYTGSEDAKKFKQRLLLAQQGFIQDVQANPKMSQADAWDLANKHSAAASDLVAEGDEDMQLRVDPQFLRDLPATDTAPERKAYLPDGYLNIPLIADLIAWDFGSGKIDQTTFVRNMRNLNSRYEAQRYRERLGLAAKPQAPATP